MLARLDRRFTFYGLLSTLLLGAMQFGASTAAPQEPAMQVAHPAAQWNDKNELLRPTDYRTWVYVGAPLTPNDMNNGKAAFPEFHSVYIDPDSYRHYLKTGAWRDGTIMVKELISVGGKVASSGAGYFMGEFVGLEASVKDAKRYAKEPGNWAYFSFTVEGGTQPKKTAAAMPTETCNSCHTAARDNYVFTEFYPVLRAAKKAGHSPENLDAAATKGMGDKK